MLWKALTLFTFACFFALTAPVLAQSAPFISSPVGGEALQGIVTINGSSSLEGFQSAELSFSYVGGEDDTWFLIDRRDTPVEQGELGAWDTTTIADGNYNLRLRVYLRGGASQVVQVEAVRVRNYSPIETSTPTAAQAGETRQPAAATSTPTSAPASLLSTPTALPTNPARLTQSALAESIQQGAIFTVLFFLAIGIYMGIRALIRGR